MDGWVILSPGKVPCWCPGNEPCCPGNVPFCPGNTPAKEVWMVVEAVGVDEVLDVSELEVVSDELV